MLLQLHLRIEQRVALATSLYAMKRRLGVCEQSILIFPIHRKMRDPNQCIDRDMFAPIQIITTTQTVNEFPSELFEFRFFRFSRFHDQKFVSAHPHNEIGIGRHRPQPIGDLAQDGIADCVSMKIVDGLEFREIYIENADGRLHLFRTLQDEPPVDFSALHDCRAQSENRKRRDH